INKVVNSVTIPSGDADPDCTVTVLDHYTTSFNWAPNNFAAMFLRPKWYVVTNSFMSDPQNAALTFVTGGDYTRASAINGYWSLVQHSIFVGTSQPDNPFAENDGPFNPASGLKCDLQNTDFCLGLNQQWTIGFESFSVEQRLYSIYDGPAFEANNAFLDIHPTIFDKCGADNTGANADCWRTNYPIAYGPVQGIMRDATHQENGQTVSRCFLPNAAIAWKQSNGFYYPPSFFSSNLFFNAVDIRRFVVEPLFDGTAYKTDETKTNKVYCKRT